MFRARTMSRDGAHVALTISGRPLRSLRWTLIHDFGSAARRGAVVVDQRVVGAFDAAAVGATDVGVSAYVVLDGSALDGLSRKMRCPQAPSRRGEAIANGLRTGGIW